ncbi:PQQ-binding-like beta-propeller repeat protein [Sulfitobacter sp. M57]|uniref:PQQ-like beta-propeller repeat protein n=1 Tax=unclassified Sulfitobacter TaxID=196795 RepID=UPI0023E13AEF|nr:MULTISPECIES: PQQ-like beta-propeller repeat protein [unclassified Sulfitobacter]MDF3413332.1 PQQ-binding-like beta-propeller repeat protein [Sulfitobacter sp. KE5]MDF3421388.1 PQQ-binding-like beta-propeller repeat protein [Sulfitobacter sp. KE43]MDF3431879.1 PQQ-binding-like beta-propeller repeat protein [Sulfitobacter sp. KE42]MDF3457519.1 PQQ-binding-like beta-propeller repeat protein [Sulfitobacter sp. S74]MDF3461421.1 PQQ-binding-like beta-propeller repeat protein [Sulfitobacter sp. K
MTNSTVFGTVSGKAKLWGLPVLAATLALGACNEREDYLPGPREDVSAVLQNPELVAADVDLGARENTSRPISLGAAKSNASWTHSTGTAKYRTSHPAMRSAPQLAWSADIGDGDSRRYRITADPVVDAGRIFTLDAGAQVSATSASGATLWTRDLTPASDKQGQGSGGGLAVQGDTLYVSIGYGVLAALDVETGGVRWTQDLDASGSGVPTVYGDLVYLTAGDDTGWALNKTDGRIEWQTSGSTSMNNVLGTPAPVLTDQLAIFSFGSGELQAVFRQGGLSRWTSAVLGKRPGRALSSISDVTSGPVISGDRVFVGNQSGRLSALNLGSGEKIWTARDGAIGPAWPAGDSIFVISDLNELLRLDASDGSRIWGTPLPNFTKSRPKRQSSVFAHHGPIVAGGRVIVASNDGMLRSFDPVNGALAGSVEIPGGATTAPVVVAGTLYVVSRKGQLLAFR